MEKQDEQPYQMLDHIIEPLPMKKGSCKKKIMNTSAKALAVHYVYRAIDELAPYSSTAMPNEKRLG
jgi:hypothetical protein